MSISNIDKIREKFEKLKKLADAMYYAAQYLTTDASKLHKAMDEYHKFIIHECKKEPKECMYSKDNYTDEDRKTLCDGCEEECRFNKKEEPVSEDLEKFINTIKLLTSNTALLTFEYGCREGAKWQKEKAINWLKSNINCDIWIKDFIKNMEGKV